MAYMSKIQRGGHIQSFGCTIAVEESTFGVIAYSENARDLLDLMPQSVPVLERREILTIGLAEAVLPHHLWYQPPRPSMTIIQRGRHPLRRSEGMPDMMISEDEDESVAQFLKTEVLSDISNQGGCDRNLRKRRLISGILCAIKRDPSVCMVVGLTSWVSSE